MSGRVCVSAIFGSKVTNGCNQFRGYAVEYMLYTSYYMALGAHSGQE